MDPRILLVALWLASAGAGNADGAKKARPCPGPGETLAIHTVVRGVIGDLKERQETVVRSEAAWKALWKRLALPLKPAPAVPKVDFTKDMIVAVAAGAGNGVLEIEIDRVERRKGCVVVSVKERKAPSGGAVAQFAAFHPFHIARVAAAKTPVSFVHEAR